MKAVPKEQKVATKPPEMPALINPKNDRQIKEVLPPAHQPLSSMILFATGTLKYIA